MADEQTAADIVDKTKTLDADDSKREPVKIKTIPGSTEKDSWKVYLPVIYWLPKYSWKDWFVPDLIGAITACIMIIPQGMGYALTAGLDARYGLYSGLFGPITYWPFGTSGQMTVAPMAVVSLMTAQTIEENADNVDDPLEAISIASAIAFQSGLIMLFLGLIKGGVLASMLGKPVLTGFKSGAGCLIALSQMKFIFRVPVAGGGFIPGVTSLFKQLKDAHGNSVILSVGCITFLMIFRTLKKMNKQGKILKNKDMPGRDLLKTIIKFFPSELVIVVICIVVVVLADNDKKGFDIIGDIPKGLPPFKNFLPGLPAKLFWNSGMWITSFLIAVLCFIETYAGESMYADKLDYQIDASQELLALGVYNTIGSWFSCFISGGALSRTVVVGESGALTPMVSFLCGIFMIICILALLPVFAFIPKPVLGSIVCVGVLGLFDIASMKHLWKINKGDFVIMFCTIIFTLLFGIDLGVGVGVVLSIVIFLQHTAKPHYSVLGSITRDADGHDKYHIYKDIKYNKNAKLRRDCLMIRWDAPIFFANFSGFKGRINKQLYRFLQKNEKFLNENINGEFALMLSFESVNDIDTTGLDLTFAFFKELKKRYKVTIIISGIKRHIHEIFRKHEDIIAEIGDRNIIYASLRTSERIWDKYLNINYPAFLAEKNLGKMTINAKEARYDTPSITNNGLDQIKQAQLVHQDSNDSTIVYGNGKDIQQFSPVTPDPDGNNTTGFDNIEEQAPMKGNSDPPQST